MAVLLDQRNRSIGNIGAFGQLPVMVETALETRMWNMLAESLEAGVLMPDCLMPGPVTIESGIGLCRFHSKRLRV